MKLYLTGLAGLGGCSSEKVVISFTRFVINHLCCFFESFCCSESVSVRIGPLSEQVPKIFTFSIKKTCHQINPEKSYHKVSSICMRSNMVMMNLSQVKSDYLLVYLAKHNPGSDWSHITYAEKVCCLSWVG